MKGLVITALALATCSSIIALWQGGRISDLEETLAAREAPVPVAPTDRTAFLGDDDSLLRSLQGRVSRLEAELVVRRPRGPAEATPVVETVPGEAPSEEAVSAIREQVDALMVGEVLETEEGRARLKELMKETRSQERQERMERWQENRKEEAREEVARFAEEHDLSNQQAQDVTRMMDTEMAAMSELFRTAREGDRSHREIRTEVRQIRDSTDLQVQDMLNEDQFVGYQAMRDEMGGPGRRRH